MSLFGRIFPTRQQRRDAKQAWQIIEAAIHKSQEPKSCAKAAASAADTRSRLFSVVDRLEAEMGQLVIALAQKEGVLMTHPRLTEELQKLPDGELLERAISLCFITPNAIERLNADWPKRVAMYRSRPNTDELISEKATVLTAYVVHNLGVGTEVSKEVLKETREITEDQELLVKIEEACLWYRLVDELANLHMPEHRNRFMDFFEDNLAQLLALQGAQPQALCGTLSARSNEYGPYRDWVSKDLDKLAGTLFWNAAKHIGAPLGLEQHFLFTKTLECCF
jgi:hypothetical protein